MLGLRYNPGLKKIQPSNLYLNFNFWSKNDFLDFEQKKYFASNGNLVIYNQPQGCYELSHGGQEKIICGKNGEFLNQNFVSLASKKPAQNFVCQRSEGVTFEQNFGENILHYQRYKNIEFLFTADKIYSCSGKNNCDYLSDYSGDLICFTKKGIVINENNKPILYELK